MGREYRGFGLVARRPRNKELQLTLYEQSIGARTGVTWNSKHDMSITPRTPETRFGMWQVVGVGSHLPVRTSSLPVGSRRFSQPPSLCYPILAILHQSCASPFLIHDDPPAVSGSTFPASFFLHSRQTILTTGSVVVA